ncbi:MAG TPA: RsmD family RNA methyltransferase [Bacteroidales bacterium]|nr:RsmD family RNA methyltransferase [Bacteroidales bacterium]
MRIISGAYKGRKINFPKNIKVRPTTDMAKEALFNILANKVNFENIRVLDLYAGTGGITFEFASRGCIEIVAVDINYQCISFINTFAKNLNMTNIKTINSSAYSYLVNNKKPFDVIFADPPYDIKSTDQLPAWVFNSNSLLKNGWLIIEHPASLIFNDYEHFVDRRTYGRVNFSFFRL